ncbi:MAG: SPFH domain-containing protein [Armatimonadota bacterium]
MSRLDWIPAGHVGIVYDANKGIVPEVYKPSAIFIGWRQQLYTYPTRLQAAIYTEDPSAGELKSADGILITTNDNASTTFDVVVLYRVKPEDVMNVFNSFGAVPIDEIQRNFIRRAVKEAANDIGTQFDLFSLMGAKRMEASTKLSELLKSKLISKGITIEAAMLGGCYPSQDIQQKIASRVNSYVELEISRLKREIAEIDRQVAIVKGEANATAAVMTAGAAKDRSIELLRLDTAELAIEKWDGALPAISPKSGQTVLLTQDLMRQLQGNK